MIYYVDIYRFGVQFLDFRSVIFMACRSRTTRGCTPQEKRLWRWMEWMWPPCPSDHAQHVPMGRRGFDAFVLCWSNRPNLLGSREGESAVSHGTWPRNREDFKEALKVRPLTIRPGVLLFTVWSFLSIQQATHRNTSLKDNTTWHKATDTVKQNINNLAGIWSLQAWNPLSGSDSGRENHPRNTKILWQFHLLVCCQIIRQSGGELAVPK